MPFHGQNVVPAVSELKDFEKLMDNDSHQYIILMNIHVGQLRSIMKISRANGKKVLLHADMVHGLKSDDYAAEFLCQEIKPDGLISTRANVMLTAKKNDLLAIQRLFLLDLFALETGYKMLKKSQPDYVEVLPGVIPHIIREVKETSGIPVFAGGLIRTSEEVESALAAGAEAATTTKKDLW